MPKGHTNNPNGRPKGLKNKATRDIRAFLQETVDWTVRRDNLIRLAGEGNMKAEEILWQYGFGKPVDLQVTPGPGPDGETKPFKHEHTHAVSKDLGETLVKLANKLADRPGD